MSASIGKVYVGKYFGAKTKPILPPHVRGILIHTSASNLGGDLSPYLLADDQGRFLENLWQFSKVYPSVTAQRQIKSRFHPKDIIWEHPAQTHVTTSGSLTPEYWDWRSKGMSASYAVRYPNGYKGRSKVLYSLPLNTDPNNLKTLTYIEARKDIYCRLYIELTKDHPTMKKLKQLLAKGTSICIIEVDGPDPEVYKGTVIEKHFAEQALEINKEVIQYLINDPSHPFGHGFTLAAILLDGQDWLS